MVSFTEHGAKDNPRMESFWTHFQGENASLFLEATTLEELVWVIERQTPYYNGERRHSRLGYRTPMGYLTGKGIVPAMFRKGDKTGSASRAQAQSFEA